MDAHGLIVACNCWIVPLNCGGVRNVHNWDANRAHCGPFDSDMEDQEEGPVKPSKPSHRPRWRFWNPWLSGGSASSSGSSTASSGESASSGGPLLAAIQKRLRRNR